MEFDSLALKYFGRKVVVDEVVAMFRYYSWIYILWLNPVKG